MIMIAILLALLTLWVIHSSVGQLLEERRKWRGWRDVDAIVTSSEQIEEPRRGPTGFFVDTVGVVHYRYEIDGVSYHGEHRFTADVTKSQSRKLAVAVRRWFPPGAAFKLHYDPRHPDRAEIRPRELSVRTQVIVICCLATLTVLSYMSAMSELP
jgi:hypothetical protein